ncbi:hypothetical protein ACFYXM_21135 [Streptomyces sp. NPDC002476]|uniref:hypothetical protein n=1 Tax=Streptomyces sp. NPDC002476 TaxID=3364648 RepID=UPI003683B098
MLGLELTDPGFDFAVPAKFRARLVEHGLERLIFDRLVEHCRQEGLSVKRADERWFAGSLMATQSAVPGLG